MQTRSKVTLLFLAMVFVYMISCTSSDKQTEKESLDSLTVTLTVLHDSLDHAWQVMIEDDDEKIQYMKRLLQEVSYKGSYDEIRLNELLAMVEQLKEIRYDRETMANSKLIDQYDSATNEVSRQVISFVYESPAYEESDLMKRLVGEIADKNGMVLIYRVHYDTFAEEINEIIVNSGSKIDTTGKEWRVWPLFKLPPEEL